MFIQAWDISGSWSKTETLTCNKNGPDGEESPVTKSRCHLFGKMEPGNLEMKLNFSKQVIQKWIFIEGLQGLL